MKILIFKFSNVLLTYNSILYILIFYNLILSHLAKMASKAAPHDTNSSKSKLYICHLTCSPKCSITTPNPTNLIRPSLFSISNKFINQIREILIYSRSITSSELYPIKKHSNSNHFNSSWLMTHIKKFKFYLNKLLW